MCLLLCAFAFENVMANPDEIISEIRFAGNEKTKNRILQQELTIRVGETLDLTKLELSRQSIMDLGLFKSVKVEVLENNIVLFTVKEKRYMLLLPRFSQNSETNKISPGVKLTLDNIGGLNQRLEVFYKQSDAEQANSGSRKETAITYRYPKIFGTQFSLDVFFGVYREPIQFLSAGVPVAEYDQQEEDYQFIVSRWLHKTRPSAGWIAGIGPRLRFNRYQYVSGLNNVYSDDRAVSLLGQIQYIDIRDYLYSRTGTQYGYVFEQGIKSIGSDYNFNRHLVFYRQFNRLGKPHHNLNWQARLGISDGQSSNLNKDVFGVGGYGELRAYDTSLGGSAFVMLNVEYLRPVFGSQQVRSLVFVDVGDAFDRNRDISLSNLKWSAGFGLRWKIKSFVGLSFSLEYAYNGDSGDNKVYFRSRGPF